ncbi:MAG: ankyrin repeat domain-containing protein [Candidatus Scalinduaceae bacterium]
MKKKTKRLLSSFGLALLIMVAIYFGFFILASVHLHDAVKNGNLSMVQLIVKVFPSSVKGKDTSMGEIEGFGKSARFTPLHWAAYIGHMDIAEVLIENGADVNAKSANGSTPLHVAATNGHTKMVTLLSDHGGME